MQASVQKIKELFAPRGQTLEVHTLPTQENTTKHSLIPKRQIGKRISERIEPPKPKLEPKTDEVSDGLPTVCAKDGDKIQTVILLI